MMFVSLLLVCIASFSSVYAQPSPTYIPTSLVSSSLPTSFVNDAISSTPPTTEDVVIDVNMSNEEMGVEVDEEEEEGEDGATIGIVETLLSSDGMFETQLSPDLLLRYRINVPDATTPETCDGCTITMETIYDGEAWVGIAFSNNGQMVGSEAVIGIPDGQKVPRKYHQYSYALSDVVPMDTAAQTLTDATVTINDVGQTIMKFTKLMKETGEIEISMVGEMGFLWAVGSSIELGYHQSRSPFAISLSTGLAQEIRVPNMTAWLVHGILAFVAWGVLIPFAIDSSLFRSMFMSPKKQGSSGSSSSLWFNLHRTLNTTAFALFIALFSIAVAVTAKEGGDHFFNSHEKVGLIMFIITTLQVVSGIFRPRLPPPESVDEEKTTARKGWEGGHRLLGVGLLACGFWQMQDGIKLYVMKYSISEENESKVVIAYWVWIGLMTATIILGLFVSTKHKGAANQQNKEQPIDETEQPIDETVEVNR